MPERDHPQTVGPANTPLMTSPPQPPDDMTSYIPLDFNYIPRLYISPGAAALRWLPVLGETGDLHGLGSDGGLRTKHLLQVELVEVPHGTHEVHPEGGLLGPHEGSPRGVSEHKQYKSHSDSLHWVKAEGKGVRTTCR